MKDSFKDLTFEELHNKQEELKKKYMDMRFNMVLGHVDNGIEKRNLRRKMARIKTIIHEYNFNELIDHTDKIKKLIKHAVDNNRIPHITKVRELL